MITREAFSFHVAPRFAIGLTAYMPTFIDDSVETRSTVSSADTVARHLSPYGSDALPEAATTTERRVSSLWGLPLTWCKRFITWIEAERRISRDRWQLMALDDRMLTDIGLDRGGIAHGVRYGRWPTRRLDGVC